MDINKYDDGSYAIGSSETIKYEVRTGRMGWSCEDEYGFDFSNQGLVLGADFVATEDIQIDSLDLNRLFSLSYTNMTDINGNELSSYDLSGEIHLSIS